jgi:tRNA1Val (adenine37-N6)-methyltransferase
MTLAEQPGDGGHEDDVTEDSLLRGRVKLFQPARGYRSSIDAVLLSAFAAPPFGRFVDLGCGAGAVAFLLLARDAEASGVGVEIQPRLARLAARGARANGYHGRFTVKQADARALAGLQGAFDTMVTNPPYRPVGSGVPSPSRERSLAHYELTLCLDDWLDAAATLLAPAGRLVAIFPASRLDELRAGLDARALPPLRLRLVASHDGAAPRRVLVEARRPPPGGAPPAPAWQPPLVVHQAGGYSAEVREMLGDG